jgi:ankyrin repeat protein
MITKGADVNAPGERETTPLMYASAYGSVEAVNILLNAKANVNARNALGMTALLWAVNEPGKVKLLLDHGADVNAKSNTGRTPLIVAGFQNHSDRAVAMLIAKGADVKAEDKDGETFLLAAAAAGNSREVRLAVEKGADINHKGAPGFTALMNAAGIGDVESVKFLISKGADVNAVSQPSVGETVKNGPINLGSFTALMFASSYGPPEIVERLLKAGAKVDPRDIRGMTALHYAVTTEAQNPAIVALLLKAGATPDMKTRAGITAAEWAAKFSRPPVMTLLRASAPATDSGGGDRLSGATSSRSAVERSLNLLSRVSDSFLNTGGCVSCHAQNVTAFAVSVAAKHGFVVNTVGQKAQANGLKAFFAPSRDGLLIRMDPPGGMDSIMYALLHLSAADVEPDATTDALVHNLAFQQMADGSWHGGGFARAPMSDSDIARTALSVRAMKLLGWGGERVELERRIGAAGAWLALAKPIYNEEYAMQILGLKWAGNGEGVTGKYAARLLDQQRADGGWSQNPSLPSDAYATGQTLYALAEAGALKPASPAFQRGVQFLLSTQHDDGSWHVKSRSEPLQPYFQSGFPYDHDQWISMAGTAWATAALALASEPATIAQR